MRLSEHNIKSIEVLCREQWHGYWVQGGVFDFVTPTAPGVYTVPSLVIITSKYVQVAACAKDFDEHEILMLSLSIEEEVGTAASERFWRPPREEVSRYPIDLDLGSFLEKRIAITVLGDNSGGNLIINSILAMHDSNQLLIAVDKEIPESILLTTNQSYIEDFIAKKIEIGVIT